MNNSAIESYLKKGLISKIVETELTRYINFFEQTYKENIEHAEAVKNTFPRWGIISGYYAMHDITKLFLVKRFSIKVDLRVHKTTILLMKSLCEQKEILILLESAYEEFLKMANDLAEAKEERMKAQYYTGSEFMKERYKKESIEFLKNFVRPYLQKMAILISDKNGKEEKDDIKPLG